MRLLDIRSFPIRVKLNQNFQLEESFDVGTILQLNWWKGVGEIYGADGRYFEVGVTVLKADLEYNKSIALRDWTNPETGNYDLNIYEVSTKNFDSNGNFIDTIFVMETDDCFDLVDELKIPKYSVEDILMIVSEIAPGLKPHITEINVDQFIEGLKRKK
jgi:uncharacterized protein YkuJ